MKFMSSRMTSLENQFKARTEYFMYCIILSGELKLSDGPTWLCYGSQFVLKLRFEYFGKKKYFILLQIIYTLVS